MTRLKLSQLKKTETMPDRPLVSVVILSYNQEEFIWEAIQSVLNQDYANIEIIISDDASTDTTQYIIRQLADIHSNIIPILHNQNQGITKNFNMALKHCKGDFCAFVGGDDLLAPGKISKQIDFMFAHSDVALSYHNVDVFDSDSGRTLYFWIDRYGKREGDVKSVIRYGPYMGAVSVMIRREHIPPNGIDERIKIVSDWFLWVYVLEKSNGRVAYFDGVLARYRRHSNNVTSAWDSKIEDQLIALDILRCYWPQFESTIRKREAEFFFMEAIRLFTHSSYVLGLGKLGKSIVYPFPALAPWIRLIIRELAFALKKRYDIDDLIVSLFSGKQR